MQKGLLFLALPLLSFSFVDLSFTKMSADPYANELSANGIYNFFAAFRNNQIDYESFYATKNNKMVFEKLRELLKEPNSTFVTTDIFDITRYIKNDGRERRLNVVVIIVESLSAEYLGASGTSLPLHLTWICWPVKAFYSQTCMLRELARIEALNP